MSEIQIAVYLLIFEIEKTPFFNPPMKFSILFLKVVFEIYVIKNIY